MMTDTGASGSAAAEALSAPLDRLLTDAAFGALRRLNPGGSGIRLAAALATKPGLVATRPAAARRDGTERGGHYVYDR